MVKQNIYRYILLCVILGQGTVAQAQKISQWKKVQVLVYTKNGKGYVHDNIPNAVACIQKLGRDFQFKVDVSDNPSVFSRENLQRYNCLIFTSTNNDIFDTDAQRLAFRHYIESGGGLVGIHAIMGTERKWTWFKQLIGGSFAWHARFQPYRVKIVDPNHPSVSGLPKDWERADECYFEKEMMPTIHTFLAQDVASLKPADDKEAALIKQHNGSFGNDYPAAWHHAFDGGLAWITTLGHDKNDYTEPVFVRHLWQGIQYVVARTAKKDWSKAYATEANSPVRRD